MRHGKLEHGDLRSQWFRVSTSKLVASELAGNNGRALRLWSIKRKAVLSFSLARRFLQMIAYKTCSQLLTKRFRTPPWFGRLGGLNLEHIRYVFFTAKIQLRPAHYTCLAAVLFHWRWNYIHCHTKGGQKGTTRNKSSNATDIITTVHWRHHVNMNCAVAFTGETKSSPEIYQSTAGWSRKILRSSELLFVKDTDWNAKGSWQRSAMIGLTTLCWLIRLSLNQICKFSKPGWQCLSSRCQRRSEQPVHWCQTIWGVLHQR